MLTIKEILQNSHEPSIRYLYRLEICEEKLNPAEQAVLQDEIRNSERVTTMLSHRQPDGGFPWGPYFKWKGAFWTLLLLTELGYPAGDASLIPLRDQVFTWLLSPQHLKSVPLIDGRWRRCALQEASLVFSSLKLGIADDRVSQLVDHLLKWQWPDGGWNCDTKPAAVHSSFHETWIPTLAMHAYAQSSGDVRAAESARRASEVFLSHKLFKRTSDGAIMNHQFTQVAYPPFWHYDILAGLRTMAAVGALSDPRCADALDLLESKRLPDGGFAAEAKYYRVSTPDIGKSGSSLVEWGSTKKGVMNEFVTVQALSVLRKAGRAL